MWSGKVHCPFLKEIFLEFQVREQQRTKARNEKKKLTKKSQHCWNTEISSGERGEEGCEWSKLKKEVVRTQITQNVIHHLKDFESFVMGG